MLRFLGCCSTFTPGSSGGDDGGGGPGGGGSCVGLDGGSPATVTLNVTNVSGAYFIGTLSPLTLTPADSDGYAHGSLGDGSTGVGVLCVGGTWHYIHTFLTSVVADVALTGGSANSPVGATGSGSDGSGNTFTVSVS